jgi:CRISPR-associated protein (TIGR02584 family)
VAVCLAGLSPAVVAESLYALAVASRPPVVPVEVHVITTHAAYPAVVGRLLGPSGALARLRADYRLPRESLRCPPGHVRVLADARGAPLEDIRSPGESRAAGECIARVVRELAADPGVALHCSLAGGRKTMSALLATALQLHGRPGDRLYHVLVNEPFERIPEFLYPPPRPARYRLDGRLVDSRRARVELVEIPFVALGAAARRLGLPGLDLERLASELEAEAQGRLRPDPLEVDLPGRRLRIGKWVVPMTPQQVALYAFYARARRRCRGPRCAEGERCARCHLTDGEVHDRRAELQALYAATGQRGSLAAAQGGGTTEKELEEFRAWLQQTRSRINRAVRQALGRGPASERYCVRPPAGADTRPGRRGLGLPSRLVTLRGGAAGDAKLEAGPRQG